MLPPPLNFLEVFYKIVCLVLEKLNAKNTTIHNKRRNSWFHFVTRFSKWLNLKLKDFRLLSEEYDAMIVLQNVLSDEKLKNYTSFKEALYLPKNDDNRLQLIYYVGIQAEKVYSKITSKKKEAHDLEERSP